MSMTAERVASSHTARCQRESPGDPVDFNCFGGIGRASGQIATGSRAKLAVLLVPAQHAKHCPLHQAIPMPLVGIGCFIDRANQRPDVGLEPIEVHGGWFRILYTDEIEPGAQLDCFVRKNGTNTASDPVTHHGISNRSSNRIPHMGDAFMIGGYRCPSHPAPLALVATSRPRQRIKGCARAERTDQADSFWRPRRRRPCTMRRPALVDMRVRKPWRFERRRTFGWKVLFTIRPNR